MSDFRESKICVRKIGGTTTTVTAMKCDRAHTIHGMYEQKGNRSICGHTVGTIRCVGKNDLQNIMCVRSTHTHTQTQLFLFAQGFSSVQIVLEQARRGRIGKGSVTHDFANGLFN